MADIEEVIGTLKLAKVRELQKDKEHECKVLLKRLDNAIHTIGELQSKIPKWHLVSEELPPIRQDILIVLRDGDMSTGYLSDEYFYVDCMSTKYVETKNVIAWMELPKFDEVE